MKQLCISEVLPQDYAAIYGINIRSKRQVEVSKFPQVLCTTGGISIADQKLCFFQHTIWGGSSPADAPGDSLHHNETLGLGQHLRRLTSRRYCLQFGDTYTHKKQVLDIFIYAQQVTDYSYTHFVIFVVEGALFWQLHLLCI